MDILHTESIEGVYNQPKINGINIYTHSWYVADTFDTETIEGMYNQLKIYGIIINVSPQSPWGTKYSI